MSTAGRAGVLFDLDGTLVDTNYLHTLAWSRALSEAGEWAPMHAVHRLVGMGGDQLLPHLLGHPCPAAEEARPRHYEELIGEAKPFPGAADLLRQAHELGLVVVIATSSPSDEVERLLRLLDVGAAVDAVTTADDVTASKPEPDVFGVALEAGGVDRRRALAVGDSVWDVRAARRAGLGCIGLEAGGFSHHELAEAGAVRVHRDVAELGDQLMTGPVAALLR